MNDRMKIPFTYGTYGGLATFAFFILTWMTGFSPLWKIRFLGFWIPILFVLRAIYLQMKANENFGLRFSAAFFCGMVAAVTIGSLRGMLVYLFIELVDYGIIDHYFNEILADYSRFNTGPMADTMQQNIDLVKTQREHSGSLSLAATDAYMFIFGGIPISLLGALLFNRSAKVKNEA